MDLTSLPYGKDTEPLYHSFMNSLVSLQSSIYPLPAMHSLLVTLSICENLTNIELLVRYSGHGLNNELLADI